MNPKYLKRLIAQYVEEPGVPYFEAILDPESVVRQFKYLTTRDREEFVSIHVDKANKPLCWEIVSVGTLSEAIISSHEVWKTALLVNASGSCFLHNHPSGRVAPSPEDKRITARLKETGSLLDIKVLDHIIVGGDSYFSFREHGLL